MKQKVTSIITSDSTLYDSCQHIVGTDCIDRIDYHSPKGEGDRHFVDMIYTNGKGVRIFNIDQIFFTGEE